MVASMQRNPSPAELVNTRFVIVCASAAALTFFAYASQIINQFYVTGAPSYDAGWFAYLLSHFDFPPANPLYIQERGIPSFFAFHVAPIMPLWGALADTLGLTPAMSFAVFQGFFHALAFLLGITITNTSLPRVWDQLVRLFVGFSLAFNPVALDSIRFPHHEMSFPILFIASLYAYSQRRLYLAGVVFVLALFVRTDAGFHVACFLLAFAVAELVSKRQLTRSSRLAAVCAILAFSYSLVAFAIQHFKFPQFNNFNYSYSRHGFAHLDGSFYVDRFLDLLALRPELFAIFLIPVGIGVLKRDLTISFGALAVLPWVALHLAAFRDIPGQLYTYYAFPFLIVVVWPWLVPLLRDSSMSTGVTKEDRRAIGVFIALCLVGWYVYFITPFLATRPNSGPRTRAASMFFPKLDVSHVIKVEKFAAVYERLLATDRYPATAFMDDAMRSLIPGSSRSRTVAQLSDGSSPFVIAYFATSKEGQAIDHSNYRRNADTCSEVSGTNVRLIERGMTGLVRSEFGNLITASDCPTG